MGLRNEKVDVHDLTPVKFGGSPTDIRNKIFIDRTIHQQQLTPFWRNIQNEISQYGL
jgi:hypothetical protein